MTTTQVSPVVGGAWNNVNKDSKNLATKTQTLGITVPPPVVNQLCSVLNEWTNCGGTGTAATRAQKRAHAIGVQIREN